MKTVIAMLALVATANVFAQSQSSYITTYSPLVTTAATTGGIAKVEAKTVLNDAQELMQTGQASAFLSQKIQETKDLNAGISDSEALDILTNSAQEILSN